MFNNQEFQYSGILQSKIQTIAVHTFVIQAVAILTAVIQTIAIQTAAF
jgi:hypothetical protein